MRTKKIWFATILLTISSQVLATQPLHPARESGATAISDMVQGNGYIHMIVSSPDSEVWSSCPLTDGNGLYETDECRTVFDLNTLLLPVIKRSEVRVYHMNYGKKHTMEFNLYTDHKEGMTDLWHASFDLGSYTPPIRTNKGSNTGLKDMPANTRPPEEAARLTDLKYITSISNKKPEDSDVYYSAGIIINNVTDIGFSGEASLVADILLSLPVGVDVAGQDELRVFDYTFDGIKPVFNNVSLDALQVLVDAVENNIIPEDDDQLRSLGTIGLNGLYQSGYLDDKTVSIAGFLEMDRWSWKGKIHSEPELSAYGLVLGNYTLDVFEFIDSVSVSDIEKEEISSVLGYNLTSALLQSQSVVDAKFSPDSSEVVIMDPVNREGLWLTFNGWTDIDNQRVLEWKVPECLKSSLRIGFLKDEQSVLQPFIIGSDREGEPAWAIVGETVCRTPGNSGGLSTGEWVAVALGTPAAGLAASYIAAAAYSWRTRPDTGSWKGTIRYSLAQPFVYILLKFRGGYNSADTEYSG